MSTRTKVINGILTVCNSVRRNTKPEVDSAGRSLRDRCIDRGLCISSVQIHKQSVSRLLPGLKPSVSSETLHLRHNKVWQCNSIATQKFALTSLNVRVAILSHCQTWLWRNATFQTRENSVKKAITDETLKPVSMALYQGPGIPAGMTSKPMKSSRIYPYCHNSKWHPGNNTIIPEGEP